MKTVQGIDLGVWEDGKYIMNMLNLRSTIHKKS